MVSNISMNVKNHINLTVFKILKCKEKDDI